MRTTLTLDDEVSAAIERIRRDEGLGLSEAVNRLAKAGLVYERLMHDEAVELTLPPARALGLKLDITNIGETLGLLDELEQQDPKDQPC